MSVVDELADEIWAEKAFHADLALLEAANIRASLSDGGLIDSTEAIATETLQRLTQVALIFSETERHIYLSAAQRISTASLRLGGTATSDLFSMIQARLRNFPALRTSTEPPIAPVNAPMLTCPPWVPRS